MSSVVNELLAVAREGFEPTRPFGPMLLRHRCLPVSAPGQNLQDASNEELPTLFCRI